MNTLKEFNNLIDSHIHNIPGISKKFVRAPFKQSVRCLNIYPENRHQSNMSYYEIAFSEKDTPKTILGIGATEEEKLSIIEDDIFIGYGEFIIYKHYTDTYTKEKRITTMDKDILDKTISKMNKPIYIHCDLDYNSINYLTSLIKDNPDKQIVLCHCGFFEEATKEDIDFILSNINTLSNECPNLWFEISWKAADYFSDNIDKLNIAKDRIIIGTDICVRDNDKSILRRIKMYYSLSKVLKNNIKELFPGVFN